eukprot:comp20686_c0_seq1/m.26922 comp20686_c0_seq1/g.26922  ORF comp20686_c0_seq1/g.26922 comp20686_c0_seq1/m.26922 type:complete len:320 (-) comp20686_c0_seq1:171-1130(-)
MASAVVMRELPPPYQPELVFDECDMPPPTPDQRLARAFVNVNSRPLGELGPPAYDARSVLSNRQTILLNGNDFDLDVPNPPFRVLPNPFTRPVPTVWRLHVPNGFFKDAMVYDSQGNLAFQMHYKVGSMHHKYAMIDARTMQTVGCMRNLYANKGPYPITCSIITDPRYKTQYAIVYGTKSYVGYQIAEGEGAYFPNETPYRLKVWEQPVPVEARLTLGQNHTLDIQQNEKVWKLVTAEGDTIMGISCQAGTTDIKNILKTEVNFLIGISPDADIHFSILAAVAMLRRTAYYSRYDDVWDPLTGRLVEGTDYAPPVGFF